MADFSQAAVTVNIVGSADGFDDQTMTVTVPVDADDTFTVFGFSGPAGELFELENWDMNGDIDPFVSQGFSFLNVANVPVTFTVTTTVPIAPALNSATRIGGSTSLTLTDANADGSASLTSVGGAPVYSGEADGVSALALFAAAYSLTTPAIPGQSVSDSASAGLSASGPTIPYGPVLSTIGITHIFELSAGDRASGTSFFQVEPTPEPTSLLVFAGLLASAAARRNASKRS